MYRTGHIGLLAMLALYVGVSDVLIAILTGNCSSSSPMRSLPHKAFWLALLSPICTEVEGLDRS